MKDMVANAAHVLLGAGQRHDRQADGPALHQLHVPVNVDVGAGQRADVRQQEAGIVEGLLLGAELHVCSGIEGEVEGEGGDGSVHQVRVKYTQAI